MRVFAIDPGPTESAYVLLCDYRPIHFAKVDNLTLRSQVVSHVAQFEPDIAAIEQIGHYGTGMPAGQSVFDTCVWIGRYVEVLQRSFGLDAVLVPRRDIKIHLCGSAKAKDPNVAQALVDRFATGQPNHGKGTKAAPGWFHGFKADVWAAYALAVFVADTLGGPT